MNDKLKWIWLADKCGPGSSEVLTLIERLGSIDNIYRTDYDGYVDAGISERLAEDLADKSLDSAYSVARACQSFGAGVLCYDDPVYPVSLKALKDPPIVLYYVGKLPDLNKRLCISIVGTRKMSEYGMRAAYKIAYEVAASGAVVISGMALGVDGIAASAALAAGGKTVAVLGCGIDIMYPREHTKLREIIKQNGAVITEYPPSTSPMPGNFPIRNRIISGLGQGTVVVDADLGSGALITAKKAILQGRDIYAVPGNIDAQNTSGTNSLIRDGAQAVLCGADIIKNYSYMFGEVLNMQRLHIASSTSDFSPERVRDMGVGIRTRDGANYKSTEDIKVGYRAEIKTHPTEKRSGEQHSELGTGEKIPHPTAVTEKKDAGDNSAKVLASLTEKQRRVFDEMPLDRAVTVDYLTKTGFALGEVISALTILEIKGLVSSLPGALYMRK